MDGGRPVDTLLAVDRLNVKKENFQLKDITIDLRAGEVHVVMGENSSGKSLLMETIRETYEDVIYIHQDDGMLTNLSVAENLFFDNMPYKNRLLKVIDYEKLDYLCSSLIEVLELPLDIHSSVGSLGMAQRQILNFCKAYVSEAKIVILDEPSAALSHNERQVLYRLIERIKQRGAGIFFITHRIDDVKAIGDRISIMHKGSVIDTMNVAETTDAQIIHMISGGAIEHRYPKLNVPFGKELLSVNDLSYNDILKQVSFNLHEGEILGITGLAGSGRSLLANCLFGVIPYEGTVRIENDHVHIPNPAQAIEHGIALMPEDRIGDSLFDVLDTNENLALPSFKRFSKNTVINSDYLRQTVMDYILRMNIKTEGMENIMSLSGGSLQKAVFAKWIMNRAKIFILDEPTKGIDIPSKIDIYNFIGDLARKGVGIILISSDIEEILGICDRVMVLSNNTVACDIPTSSTTVEDIIKIAAYT